MGKYSPLVESKSARFGQIPHLIRNGLFCGTAPAVARFLHCGGSRARDLADIIAWQSGAGGTYLDSDTPSPKLTCHANGLFLFVFPLLCGLDVHRNTMVAWISEAQRRGPCYHAEFSAHDAGRWPRFGLKLHPTKTRLIEFGRYAAAHRRGRGRGNRRRSTFWDGRTMDHDPEEAIPVGPPAGPKTSGAHDPTPTGGPPQTMACGPA